jgi:hypothetical protein
MAVRFWKEEEDPETPSGKLWDTRKWGVQNSWLGKKMPYLKWLSLTGLVIQTISIEINIMTLGLWSNNHIQQSGRDN